jgi:hypothetical protein
METPNPAPLTAWWRRHLDLEDADILRALRTFNAYSEAFRKESEAYEHARN